MQNLSRSIQDSVHSSLTNFLSEFEGHDRTIDALTRKQGILLERLKQLHGQIGKEQHKFKAMLKEIQLR